MRTEAEIRKLNLIEVLLEDAEADGNPIDEPPAEAVEEWSEDDIREYFRSGGAHRQTNVSAPEDFNWPAVSEEEYLKWFPRSKGLNETRASLFPTQIVAHSMGTWVAYEFLVLARARGLQMPQKLFISGMPSPDIPSTDRPWRQQNSLNDEEFKDECRCWDINEVVFSKGMWEMYQPMLRSDFTIFDEYMWNHAGEAAFDVPLCCFWGTRDKRVTQKMVEGWEKFGSEGFECIGVEGNHLWPLDKEAKLVWLSAIVERLENLA
ncbi:hypothetical protein BSKO_06134 [Bryopsis sp. KO-2023]|nr:hypothetical protein BSKO_06134 [Bryopsis sp. KO-2023]